jgi:tRNA threonylcarbamoyladenosine biosynthesis protein TsaB
MMRTVILHIEASTEVCSVALSQDGLIFFERESNEGLSHAKVLAPFVQEAIDEADRRGETINAVAVSCGPGSYTSLRIASSTAKGVCYGRNIPLIALPTLQIMCVPILLYHDEIPEDALFCPMIDARRMEVYAAIYDRGLNIIRETQADIVENDSYHELLEQHPIFFFGNGANKCKDIIDHPNAHFLNDIHPLAKYMFPLAEQAIAKANYADVAYFEPYYLKEFVASTPKKQI